MSASSLCVPETVNRRRSWKRRASSRRKRSEEDKWLRLFQTSQHPAGKGRKKKTSRMRSREKNNKQRTGSQPADRNAFFHNQSKYKRELCNNYRESGWCRYGLNCNYAHGEEELRGDFRREKINKKCMHYHGIGICMFGTRCRYIHDETEEEIAQMSDPKNKGVAHTVEFPIPEKVTTLPSETHIPLYKRCSSLSI